jgi:H+/Cl- antiporter ClcA
MSDPTAASPTSAAGPTIQGRDYLRLVGIGAGIGIPAALVAVAFLDLVHELEQLLWTTWPKSMGLSEPPWWMVLFLPVVGAAIVWLARTALPGDGGHEPLEGISIKPTPWEYAPSVALAALGTLAFGAVLGPEAPLIALGSMVGMLAVRWFKVGDPADKVLSTSGSMAAISALFGGPIVAGAMMLEAGVGMGAALIPALIPGLVASAIGYTIIVGFGSWTGIPVASLTVPGLPPYATTRVIDLLGAIVIGVILAVLVLVVRQVGHRVRDARARFGTGPVLLASGLAVGALATAVQLAGGSSQDVLFSGQTSLPYLVDADKGSLLILVVLAKALAYAICLGGGFRGGPVFPAIFIGVGVAVLLGFLTGMSPTAAVAIGTACGMAAFTRLILTSLIFAMLITGTSGAGAIPAAVLAAVTAWLIGTVVERRQASRAAVPPTP